MCQNKAYAVRPEALLEASGLYSALPISHAEWYAECSLPLDVLHSQSMKRLLPGKLHAEDPVPVYVTQKHDVLLTSIKWSINMDSITAVEYVSGAI